MVRELSIGYTRLSWYLPRAERVDSQGFSGPLIHGPSCQAAPLSSAASRDPESPTAPEAARMGRSSYYYYSDPQPGNCLVALQAIRARVTCNRHPTGAPSPKVPDGAESRPPVVGQSAGGLWNHSDDCREKRKMGPKLLA
ncbi:hypothetical protein MCOR23_007532 [Pyricularia oryzae]|nr:hypothetical protein MCOR26_008388 [Pyricularia oryzae]KAI6336823.1 hypothetical protein MCOR28_008953 [Pyricularia oryzae]KAI6394425.1 hypothetical protein MCOR23_007532 [Pyricularia oryzae]KAI6484620.1 hypothetical protein MCOR11_010019 [Pyricularia oryzae]KAI6632527.1 hypothetical protein MCOR08_005450 [Pyricularia oryzae]